MALPKISGEFLVIADPELRFTPNGVAVAKVRVGGKKRKEEPKGSGTWVDDKNFVATLEFWRDKAEQYTNLLNKFDVIAVSNADIHVHEYEHEGNKRTELVIDGTYSTVGVLPPRPQQGQQGQGQGGYQQGQQGQPQGGYQQAPQGGYQQPQQGGYQQAPQGGYPQGQPGYQQAPAQGAPMQGGWPQQGQPGQAEPPF